MLTRWQCTTFSVERIVEQLQGEILYCPLSHPGHLVLSVFLGLELSDNTLQLPLGFTLREVAHLVVLWSDFDQPGWEKKIK